MDVDGAIRRGIHRELERVAPNSLSGRQLETLVYGRASTVRAVCAQLTKEGQLIRTKGPQHAYLYRLPHLEPEAQYIQSGFWVHVADGQAVHPLPVTASHAPGASKPAVEVTASAPPSVPECVPPVQAQDEVRTAVPSASSLTCQTVVDGARCGKPVEGYTVWCRGHKATLLARLENSAAS